jgi:hypothetical protein
MRGRARSRQHAQKRKESEKKKEKKRSEKIASSVRPRLSISSPNPTHPPSPPTRLLLPHRKRQILLLSTTLHRPVRATGPSPVRVLRAPGGGTACTLWAFRPGARPVACTGGATVAECERAGGRASGGRPGGLPAGACGCDWACCGGT